jgi:hypothetical protein
VVGLGRGLIDCFFPRMKEDFSNILQPNRQENWLVAKFIGKHEWSEVQVYATLLFIGDDSALL